MMIVQRFRNQSTAWQLVVIFLLAIVGREVVVFSIADAGRLFEYQLIAANLIQGKGISWDEWGRLPLQPTALFPPIYVYWCAMFMWVFGQNFLPMLSVQALVAASGCFPAFLIGKYMFSRRVGMLFALAYSVYPELIFTPSRSVPEFLYIVICLWLLACYARMSRHDTASRGFLQDAWLFGLLTGVGLMVREGVLIVSGSGMLALMIAKRPFWRIIHRAAVPVGLATALVLTPWTVRNWIVQGRFIPLRSAYGLNLWMGNHAEATGTDKTMDGEYQMNLLWTKNRDYYAHAIPQTEYDRNQFYRSEAIKYIASHPSHYLQLTAKRLYYFLWFDPTHPLAKNIVYRASYVLLLLMAIPGIVWAARSRKLDAALIIAFFGFLILYVPVIILPRYRIIPVVFLLLMASYAVDQTMQWWRAHQSKAN